MSFSETLGDNELILMSAGIRKDYNELRQKYFKKCRQYYNQAIASTYHKEDDLIKMLNELARLKDEYLRICDILKNRGVPYSFKAEWQGNNNHLFNHEGELLHSA